MPMEVGLDLPQRRHDPPLVRTAVADRRFAPDSRRAVLADLQASQLDALVRHKVEAGPIHTDLPILGGGTLR